jgi:hypothetical protein
MSRHHLCPFASLYPLPFLRPLPKRGVETRWRHLRLFTGISLLNIEETKFYPIKIFKYLPATELRRRRDGPREEKTTFFSWAVF